MFKRQHLAGMGGGSPAKGKSANESSAVHKAEENRSIAADGLANSQPASPGDQPGEFTRYFTGGLPTQSPRNISPTPQRPPSGVQRPNTPVPPGTLTGENGSDSFAAHFGNAPAAAQHKTEEYGIHNPCMGPALDLSKQATADGSGTFDFKPRIPRTTPLKDESPSEYTALFDEGNVPPTPRQVAPAPLPTSPMMRDSPGASSRAVEAPQVPSELTVISNGRPPVAAESAPSGDRVNSSTAKVPVSVQIQSLNTSGSLGNCGCLHSIGTSASVGMQGPHVTTPLGAVNVQGPRLVAPTNALPNAKGLARLTDRTKLFRFFDLLSIISIVFAFSIVSTQKN